MEDIDTIRSTLKDRGLRFIEYMEPTHQQYVGPTLKYHPGGDECDLAQELPEIESNVVVDFKEAERFNSKWVPKLGNPRYVEHEDSSDELMERYPRYIWKDKSRLQLLPGKEEQVQNDKIIDRCSTDDFIASDSYTVTVPKKRRSFQS